MFEKNLEIRLDSWRNLRKNIENHNDPLQFVWDNFRNAPFIPYNNKIDRYDQSEWPTPWEIIADNIYDDFVKSLLIGWTLLLTEKFSKSVILIKTMVDNDKNCEYNIVYVDNHWVLNYDDSGPILADSVPDSFIVENLIELRAPR